MNEYIDKLLALCRSQKCGRHTLRVKNCRNIEVLPEGYRSSYAAGELTIVASTAKGECYALSQLKVAAQAGQLSDFLGDQAPKFPSRILWPAAEVEVPINSEVSVFVPEFLTSQEGNSRLPDFCQSLLSYGFNTLLLGSHSAHSRVKLNKSPSSTNLQSLLEHLKQYGISLIVKPSFAKKFFKSESFETSLSAIFEFLPSCDGLFWDSVSLSPEYRNKSFANGALAVEAVIDEVHLLERSIAGRAQLYFYLSALNLPQATRQTAWISSLLDEMSGNSSFLFSAVAGNFYHDHLPDHPLWNELRQEFDPSATTLLPIINFGLVGHGEGLWPVCNNDILERFIPRCHRHQFNGIVGIVGRLPRLGSFLDSRLWVAGQSLWQNKVPSLLTETWHAAFRSHEEFFPLQTVMKRARALEIQLSEICEMACIESRRRHGESLPYVLRQLELMVDKLECSSSVKLQFAHFMMDVRRVLERGLQLSPKMAAGTNSLDEQELGFWTDPRGRGELLNFPLQGSAGSSMEAIFKENRDF
jgi:hypothetical protein